MSEQQFEREQSPSEEPIHEDPLAELARIVAGEDLSPSEPAPRAAHAPSVVRQPVTPTASPIAIDPIPANPNIAVPANNTAMPEVPAASPAAGVMSVVEMDLESQLMAELGGSDTSVQPQAPVQQTFMQDAQKLPVEADIVEAVIGVDTRIASTTESVAEPDFETMLERQLVQGDVAPVAQQIPSEAMPIMDEQTAHVAVPDMAQLAPAATIEAVDEVPQSVVQALDEMDFTVAFDNEMELTQTAPVDDLPQENFTQVANPQTVPPMNPPMAPSAVEPTNQTSDFHFQPAPDHSLQEQKINESVNNTQNDFVEELNIEDAFSDAFADEISIELNNQAHQAAPSELPAAAAVSNVTGEPAVKENQIPAAGQLPLAPAPQQMQAPLERDEPPVVIAPMHTNRGFRMAAIALSLAVIAGGTIVGYGIINESTGSGEPVLIRADTNEFKVKPEEPGGKKIANQDQPVYDAVAGEKISDSAQETLISANEEPVDVARSVVPVRPEKSGVRLITGENVVQEEVAENSSLAVMQPRKVKTVTVRADGTIVSVAPDTVANLPGSLQAALTPEGEPAVNPSATNSNSIDGANTTGRIAVPRVNPGQNTVTALVKPVETAINDTSTRSLGVPVAAPKPVTTALVSTPVSTPVSAPTPVGDYAVQISSQRSIEAAEATYQNLKRRFAGMLGDQPREIREAKVDGKGTFYRVRIPQGTKSQAIDFCTRYKSAGGSCFVTR